MDWDELTPTGGTAIVVVPGVGDDGPGDTVGSMTGALLREMGPGARAIPYTRSIVVPARPGSGDDEDVHDVHCAMLLRPGRDATLMLYEMHWADLSRFPATAFRFVLTLYGLLFQVGVFGLESFAAVDRWSLQKLLIRLFSFLMVVVIVGLTAGAALLGIEFSAADRFVEDGRGVAIAIATVALLVSLGLAISGDRFLRARGWRFTHFSREVGGRRVNPCRPAVALVVIALGVGVAPLVVRAATDHDFAYSAHAVLWFSVRWILPFAWALVAVIALVLSAVQLVLMRRAARDPADDAAYRANRTVVLSVVIGGLGIAVLGALLVATALGLVIKLMGPTRGIPHEVTRDMPGAPTTFPEYAGEVFAHALQPLGVALLCSLALLGALVVAAFRYASALVQARSATRPMTAALTAVAVAGTLAVAGVVLLLLDAAWADLAAVVALGLAATAAALAWIGRFRADDAAQPMRRGFDLVLRYLGGRAHVGLLVLALAVASAALLLATPLTRGAGDRLGDFSDSVLTPFKALAGSGHQLGSTAQISTTVVLLVAVAALLRTRLAPIARGLDLAYDVATYLRVTHGAPSDHDPVEPPRRKVLRRYAAVLGHIDTVQKPERIVIVSHSQGSMYSLALLFRDAGRDRADTRDPRAGWTVAPSRSRSGDDAAHAEPFPALGAELRLVTCGCPVLQTYSPSFPAQYEWPADPAAATARVRSAEVASWRNLYRSGDYVGRALWSHACGPDFADGPLSERCIGPGQHTGYWGDPRFASEVLRLAG